MRWHKALQQNATCVSGPQVIANVNSNLSWFRCVFSPRLLGFRSCPLPPCPTMYRFLPCPSSSCSIILFLNVPSTQACIINQIQHMLSASWKKHVWSKITMVHNANIPRSISITQMHDGALLVRHSLRHRSVAQRHDFALVSGIHKQCPIDIVR